MVCFGLFLNYPIFTKKSEFSNSIPYPLNSFFGFISIAVQLSNIYINPAEDFIIHNPVPIDY